jgi:hypothetical protein
MRASFKTASSMVWEALGKLSCFAEARSDKGSLQEEGANATFQRASTKVSVMMACHTAKVRWPTATAGSTEAPSVLANQAGKESWSTKTEIYTKVHLKMVLLTAQDV